MYIEKLGDKRLMIRLTERELTAFIDERTDGTRSFAFLLFEGLFRLAAAKYDVDLRAKRISFKLFAAGDLFFIIADIADVISICPPHSDNAPLIMIELSNAELLITFLERFANFLTDIKSTLYIEKGRFILILRAAVDNELPVHQFCEYGSVTKTNKLTILHLDEFADNVIPDICCRYYHHN